MGAICGIFHTDGKPVESKIRIDIMDKLSAYRVDNSEIWCKGEVFLGCAIQYVTPESRLEKLPYFDDVDELVITADAIIDNREELLSLMNVPKFEYNNIADSQLILMAYKKWGEECPKYLIGDFAFAIWDVNQRELFCARDHVGNRTFYFYYSKNTFAFCTVMKPLLETYYEGKRLNDSWIADFLALDGPIHEVDCNQTVYEDIKQLPPAFKIKLNANGLVKQQYWYPLETPKLKFNSDEEYEEAFREVLSEAVRCRLRSSGSIGIMLSGGLDSGSIACIAAKELALKGQKLKAFSAVPFSGYKDWIPNTFIADEREYISTILEHAKNIEVTYCKSEGKNSITNIDEFLEILEQPYKFIENFFWMNEIVSTAAKSNCSVLLDGQFGNLSISFGDIATHLVSLYRKGKWITIFSEIRGYCKLYDLKYSNVLKAFVDIILPNNFRKSWNSIGDKNKNNKSYESRIPVNPQLALKWGVEERFKQSGIGPFAKRSMDLTEVRKTIVSPTIFSHMGAVDTKMSLAYGLVRRDPSRDKRVIEFCLSVPGEQYVRHGHERSLIRRSMIGILPDEVRLNYKIRGQQSADWVQRLSQMWVQIQKELEGMMQKSDFQSYIDVPKILNVLKDVGDNPNEKKIMSLRMIIISLIFGRFINNFEG